MMNPNTLPRTAYPDPGRVAVGQSRVLRNTYLPLALTMVPTVVGAFSKQRSHKRTRVNEYATHSYRLESHQA